jgi:putative acetyltransferase
MAIEIRPATAADLDAILAVQRAAFGRDAEAALVRRLHDAGRASVSLVADDDGAIVGHVMFSPVTVEHGDDGQALGLAPVGVLPARQHQGIGHALIEEGLGACFGADARAVFVLGTPGYYARFGFVRASAFGLVDTYGGDDAFMVLPMTIDGLGTYRGRVDYAAEFAGIENP